MAPEVTGCWITQYENHANGDHSKLAWAHMLQIAIDSAAEVGDFKAVKRLSQLRIKKTEKPVYEPKEEEKMTKEEKRAARFENPRVSKKLGIQVPKKMFSKRLLTANPSDRIKMIMKADVFQQRLLTDPTLLFRTNLKTFTALIQRLLALPVGSLTEKE